MATIPYHNCGKSCCNRIQRTVIHADVARQSREVQVGHTLSAQIVGQAGRFAVTVVKESAVTVDFQVHALSEDGFDPVGIQRGAQRGDAGTTIMDAGVKVTGCTIHVATLEVDAGPILAQEAVPVLPDDDVSSLHERIKAVERRLYPATIRAVLADPSILEREPAST